jgi:hypothetical protein
MGIMPLLESQNTAILKILERLDTMDRKLEKLDTMDRKVQEISREMLLIETFQEEQTDLKSYVDLLRGTERRLEDSMSLLSKKVEEKVDDVHELIETQYSQRNVKDLSANSYRTCESIILKRKKVNDPSLLMKIITRRAGELPMYLIIVL